MATLNFTQQLARFMALAPIRTDAPQLRGGLESAFAAHPRLRAYMLDEQGHLRRNVVIFIDGALYAALNLGHFGVKLHRRDAGSAQWPEIGAPA